MIWIMHGTDWSHYRAKDRSISKWLNKMEDLTDKVEDLFGVHLVWHRGRNKHMLMEELLCPVINTITSEVKVIYHPKVYSKQKVFGQRYTKTKGIRVPKVFENEKLILAKSVRPTQIILVMYDHPGNLN